MSVKPLSIQNLNVYYGSFQAVKDLSFELETGDVCALVGPNGAGKTSTIRAIAGLYRHIKGDIHICGQSWEENDRQLTADFGYMPDLFPMPDQLKVWEFLEHFALAFKITEPKKRIAELLEQVGLKEKMENDCSELSRGMQQRLMLAKTLIHDPDFLVLDEPASGLDPKARSNLKDLFLELSQRGKTILISSHILSELSAFCNKVAIMEKGLLKKFGAIDGINQDTEFTSVLLRWRDSKENVESLLKEFKVSDVKLHGRRAEFSYLTKSQENNNILKKLVAQNVEILEWRVSQVDLEQIYIDSGAEEVT